MNRLSSFRSALVFLGAAFLSVVSSAQVSSWKIDPVHSGIEFKIRHLGVSNVRGRFSGPTGVIQLNDQDVTKSSVEATINAASISTDSEARDKHLKSPDFFDVEKYPTLTFKSTSITKSGGKLMLTGDLTMVGVTKSVTLTVDGPAAPQKGPRGGTVSGFSATGTIHRKDFNFGSKYPPPALGDDVDFTIDIEMDKQ